MIKWFIEAHEKSASLTFTIFVTIRKMLLALSVKQLKFS
jgi:hypothetical protein